jgi:hypothetical protein
MVQFIKLNKVQSTMNRFKTKLTLFMTMALFNMVHIQGAALPPSTHRHTKKDRQIWGVRYDRGAKILADMYDHPQGIEWSEQQTKKAMARMTEDYKRLNTYAATLMNDRHNPEAACQLDRLFQLFIKNLKESHNQLHFRDRLHARASKYAELPAGDVCFRGRNDKRGPDDSDDFGIQSVSVPTKLLLGKYNNYDSVNKQKSTALIRKLFGMIPADIVGQEQSADFQSTMKSYATSFYRRAMYANRHPNNEAISQEHDELITKENKLALEFRQEHPLLLKSKEFYPQNCEQIRKNLDATKELKKFLHGTNRGQKISQDVVRGTLQDLKPNVHIDTVQDFLDAVKVIEEIWKKENKILQDIEEIQTHIGGDVVHYLMDNKECLKPRFLNKLYSGLDADIDEKSSESSTGFLKF